MRTNIDGHLFHISQLGQERQYHTIPNDTMVLTTVFFCFLLLTGTGAVCFVVFTTRMELLQQSETQEEHSPATIGTSRQAANANDNDTTKERTDGRHKKMILILVL